MDNVIIKLAGNPINLTRGQKRIAVWMLKGLASKAIARRLSVEETTVKKHESAIYAKAGIDFNGINKRVALLAYLVSVGMVKIYRRGPVLVLLLALAAQFQVVGRINARPVSNSSRVAREYGA